MQMAASDAFLAVRALARELPFDFADMEAAGQTYVECRTQQVDVACHRAQVWAYCYVLRYFIARFTYDTQRDPVDCDRLVADCFAKVLGGMAEIHDEQRFPHWVSVVCKNTFRSYLRTHAPQFADLPEDLPSEEPDDFDPTFAHLAFMRALARLPEYLRDVARRRLLEEASYESLAAEFGKPVEVMRAYVKKARERLQQDPDLRSAAGRA